MSYHKEPVAHSGHRKTRRPRVIIAGFFLHLVHWKVNTALNLLTYLGFPVFIGVRGPILKPDSERTASVAGRQLIRRER
jgi:hypothetical protein